MSAEQPVLIAYDGSEGAGAAVEAAGRLFPGRRAIVLTVWHSAATAAPASLVAIPVGVAASAYEQLDREAEQRAATIAAEGVAHASAAGLEATAVPELCRGQVWATIVDAAEREGAEAVVVGSRGRSPVQSALLGSVANAVVHHSARPVVVAPHPQGR